MHKINSIILGDCLEVMKEIPDQSIDMILCDLPYGTTDCKWDCILPFEKLWEAYNRVIKINGNIVLTASQPFTSSLIMSNIDMFRYELIWEKNQGTNPMLCESMPMKYHENILVFYKQKGIYNPQMWKSTPYYGFSSDKANIGEIYGKVKSKHRNNPDGSRYPKSILKFNQEKGLHPTQKPINLFKYLIKTYSNENDIVLDNCAGSGTTGCACIDSNRRYILIEKEEKYIQVIKNRIQKHKKEKEFLEALF